MVIVTRTVKNVEEADLFIKQICEWYGLKCKMGGFPFSPSSMINVVCQIPTSSDEGDDILVTFSTFHSSKYLA